MKKIMICIIAVIFFVSLFTISAYAIDDETYKEQLEESGFIDLYDSIDSQTQELLEKYGIESLDAESLLSLEFNKFIDVTLEIISVKARSTLMTAFAIMGIVIVYTLINLLFPESVQTMSASRTFSTLCQACCIAFTVPPILDVIYESTNNIILSGNFILSYVPIISSVSAAGGHINSSAVYSSMMTFFCSAIIKIFSKIIIPIISIFLSITVVGNMEGSIKIHSLSSLINKVATWCTSLVATVFIAVFSIKGSIGSSADSIAIRTSKFLIGSVIPIVGGSVADATATVTGSLSMLRNTIGIFGILIILMMFLPSLLSLIMWNLTIWISYSIGELFDADGICKTFKSISKSITLMIALSVCTLLIFIVSTAIFLSFSSS